MSDDKKSDQRESDKKDDGKKARVTVSQGRRSFLTLAAIGAPAAALAATGGAARAATPTMAANAAGYRETAHIRKYLETARF